MAAPPSIFAKTWLAFSRAETGAFAEALAQAADALRIAETLGHPYGHYHGHLAVGAVRFLKGDLELAVPALQRALRITRESSMFAMSRPTVAHLGSVYGLIGRLEEATAVLEDSLGEAMHRRWNAFLPLEIFGLAQVYLLSGRIVEAEQMAMRALERAQSQEQRGNEARVRWVLGEIAARSAPAEADGRYRSALALARELDMRPLVAHCHLGLSKLYRRTGKRQDTQEHLTLAITMYRKMDMRLWLEQAEAEMKECG
jgi:tetratricopeptide (TPR) repeat protein